MRGPRRRRRLGSSSLRLPIMAACALTIVAVGAYTGANNVEPSRAGDTSVPLAIAPQLPSACSGTTPTNTISGLSGVIAGTVQADWIVGSDAIDTISGLAGDDCIQGEGSADVIDGGIGTDVCIGGAGIDTFVGCETEIQ